MAVDRTERTVEMRAWFGLSEESDILDIVEIEMTLENNYIKFGSFI